MSSPSLSSQPHAATPLTAPVPPGAPRLTATPAAVPVPSGVGHAMTAAWWGAGGGLLALVPVGLVTWVGWPRDTYGFEDLSWFLLMALVGVATFLAVGATCVAVGLRRAGCTRAGRTALAFVPIALLAALLTGGVGALAAPALAHWFVDGLSGRPDGWSRRDVRRAAATRAPRASSPDRGGAAVPGVSVLPGHPADVTPPAPAPWQPLPVPPPPPWRRRLPQLVLASLALGVWFSNVVRVNLADVAGNSAHGGLLLWGAMTVAAALPAVLLLRRRLPVVLLAGVVLVVGVLTVLPARAAVAGSVPGPERFAAVVADVEAPAGVVVTDLATTRGDRSRSGHPDLSTTTLASAPVGAAPVAVPPGLRADASGYLPDGAASAFAPPAPPTALGLATAERWEEALLAQGWQNDPDALAPHRTWLTAPATAVTDGARRAFEQGSWLYAEVVPTGDGALVVLSVRP